MFFEQSAFPIRRNDLNVCLNLFFCDHSCFSLYPKQNRDLKSRYSKSGAGQIPLEEQLDKTELMILTYLGEEAATGIPNVARAPVKPGDEKFLLTPETKINRTATKNPNHLDDISSLMQEENPHTEPNKDDVHEVSSSTHSDVEDLNEPGVQRVEDDFDDVNFPAFDPSLGQSTVEVIGKWLNIKLFCFGVWGRLEKGFIKSARSPFYYKLYVGGGY